MNLFYFRCHIDDYFKSANQRVCNSFCMCCRVLYPFWWSLCGGIHRCYSTFLHLLTLFFCYVLTLLDTSLHLLALIFPHFLANGWNVELIFYTLLPLVFFFSFWNCLALFGKFWLFLACNKNPKKTRDKRHGPLDLYIYLCWTYLDNFGPIWSQILPI